MEDDQLDLFLEPRDSRVSIEIRGRRVRAEAEWRMLPEQKRKLARLAERWPGPIPMELDSLE